MEKFSQEWWSTISCTHGCANCCPKDCSHLTSEKLCDVHPSKFGGSNHEAEKHGRGMGCRESPIQAFINTVYCPPIVAIMEQRGF